MKYKYKISLFCLDVICIIVSSVFANIIYYSIINYSHFALFSTQIIVNLIVFILIFYITGLYDFKGDLSKQRLKAFSLYFSNFIFIGGIVALVNYFVYFNTVGRWVWLIQLTLAFLLIAFCRIILNFYFSRKMPPYKIMIIGQSTINDEVIAFLEQYSFYEYVGSLIPSKNSFYNIQQIVNIEKKIEQQQIDALILTDQNINDHSLEKFIMNFKMKGVAVYSIPLFFETFMGKVPINQIDDYWVISNTFFGLHHNLYNDKIKRLLDIFISLVGIMITSPLCLLTALIIKLTSRGPILFKQPRVGQNGEIFNIYKFRSMKVNRELENLYTADHDERITLVGKFIRKVRIDELPQFFNVLKGDLSLIGPRAEWDKLVEQYQDAIPYYDLRHLIKPGITGWAQVNYHYSSNIEEATEKFKYDLYYVRHLSFRLDLAIFFKTIKTMLTGSGAK